MDINETYDELIMDCAQGVHDLVGKLIGKYEGHLETSSDIKDYVVILGGIMDALLEHVVLSAPSIEGIKNAIAIKIDGIKEKLEKLNA